MAVLRSNGVSEPQIAILHHLAEGLPLFDYLYYFLHLFDWIILSGLRLSNCFLSIGWRVHIMNI